MDQSSQSSQSQSNTYNYEGWSFTRSGDTISVVSKSGDTLSIPKEEVQNLLNFVQQKEFAHSR